MSEQYEPVIVGFLCNWCSYRAADLAGTSRLHYSPNMRVIRVMCSGRVDPQFVIKALKEGALGVEEERVQLVWASASEGIILAKAVDRMTEQLRDLGPLRWQETVLSRNGHGLIVGIEAEPAYEEV
jgi:F420-non-reducing hydrogenase iron-sulfur subunit